MIETYTEQLRAHGYRITPQREMIIEILAHSNTHMAAEEIFEALQTRTKALNIATVYRTLDLLVEEGLACRNDLGGGFVIYAIMRHGPHIHLVCRHCGQVTEADYPLISPLGEQLQERYGFFPDLQHVSISGLCAECRSNRARRIPPGQA
jgi:Fur family ferric uptake transcriptional regulator